MREVVGSLTDAKETYIVHQTNCISRAASGLAKHIFEKFPYAEIYRYRDTPSTPGTIMIRGDGIDKRFVVNLNGQYAPGVPRPNTGGYDSESIRQGYFKTALDHLANAVNEGDSIAFPFKIGCGLAGGDWSWYRRTLEIFSDALAAHNIDVAIYRRAEGK